jgi:putative exosortase-associated protein (TIGR04073 family)
MVRAGILVHHEVGRTMWLRVIVIAVGIGLYNGQSVVAEEFPLKESGTKFVRGVANISTGWLELPKQIHRIGTQEGWVTGTWRGPFEGLGMLIARTVAGAYEVLTFLIPVPPRFQPLLQPDFVWQPDVLSSEETTRPSQ